MRVIFEKALRDVPVEKSEPIWDRFIAFQSISGDLEAVELAEKRRFDALKVGTFFTTNIISMRCRSNIPFIIIYYEMFECLPSPPQQHSP